MKIGRKRNKDKKKEDSKNIEEFWEHFFEGDDFARAPDIIASEIVENLEFALEQLQGIMEALEKKQP
jgi:hypothetical protein